MLIGNVGKDPEVRYLDGNNNPNSGSTKVATFTLATTERYRDRNGELRENTEWHNIVAWRNSADIAEKYIRKGTQLYVEGKLRTRSWTDQTGEQEVHHRDYGGQSAIVRGGSRTILVRRMEGRLRVVTMPDKDSRVAISRFKGTVSRTPRQAQGPVSAAQGPVGNAAQGPAYAQPQYQQGGYQPVRQPTPQPVQQPGFQQQPIQQPQQQAPVNPIEVAAADMPQDDLPF